MRASVSEKNVEKIAHDIRTSGDKQFDLSGSEFNLSTVQKLFRALGGLPQPLELRFNNCRFEPSEQVMLEFRMNLMTTRIRDIELTDVHTGQSPQSDSQCMHYFVSGLCRNQWLRIAVINGVSPNAQAVVDLERKLPTVRINGEEKHQQKPSLFAGSQETNGHAPSSEHVASVRKRPGNKG